MNVYDKAKWHFEGDFPRGLPVGQAYVHIGFYLGWAIDRGFSGSLLLEDFRDELEQYRARKITYRVQLFLFSAAALVALVAGIGGIFRRVWAAYVLLTLSWIGALYFLGTGVVLALWPLFPGSEATFQPLLFVVAGGIAMQGGPFLAMALFLRRCTKASDVLSESA